MPYNIDGLSEVRVAQDIMATGGIEFPVGTSQSETYVTDMPISGLFVAFVSASLGVEAATSILPVGAIIGAVTVVVISLAILRHLPHPRSYASSALVLALLGSFAFSAGCAWKETFGIFLLGVVLVSYLPRKDMKYRVLLFSSLVLLVFTHHHTAVVTLVIVTFAFLIGAYNDAKKHERRLLLRADTATYATAWVVAAVYYSRISLPYLDYLSPQTDLYLYLAVGFLVLLIGFRASRRMYVVSQYPLGIIVPALGVAFLLYNFHDPIFPGIPAPSLSVVVPFMAYILLVIPAWYGSELLLGPRGPSKDLLLAILLGPISFIMFAFLRSNDSTSYLIVYRTFDFLMIPFAVLVGAGFVYLVRGRERLGILAGISLVVICASTLPVAYNTQELFGVQNHTFEYEYDAVQWFSLNGIDNYTSDQRLGETGWRLFDIDFARGLPYDLREGIALDPGSFYVLEESWISDGAQEFPFGVVVVEPEKVLSVLDSSSVAYVGGQAEDQIVLFATMPSG